MTDSHVTVDSEPDSELGRRLDAFEDELDVAAILELAFELRDADEGTFEDFCRAVSFGEAYLPLPSEDGYSEQYNDVYSRLTSRATRLRVEGERVDGERAAFVDAVERLSSYSTDASRDDMESFIAATDGDWLDSVQMFWEYDDE